MHDMCRLAAGRSVSVAPGVSLCDLRPILDSCGRQYAHSKDAYVTKIGLQIGGTCCFVRPYECCASGINASACVRVVRLGVDDACEACAKFPQWFVFVTGAGTSLVITCGGRTRVAEAAAGRCWRWTTFTAK